MSNVTVHIPTPLRQFTGGQDSVQISAPNVSALIENLEQNHPGLKERLCDNKGKLRRFVNIYANDEDIRYLDNLETALNDGDEVSIVPAIAGGAS